MSSHPRPAGGWLGAVEGYYGPPLAHAERLALVEWLGTQGFNAYGYAPKDDPFHRARWREPYPPEKVEEFRALVEAGERAGVAIAVTISPGLDFRDGPDDVAALIAKLRSFADLGVHVLGVAWDDVPPGGADLGARHGWAVAAAVEAIGTATPWITCPTDYGTPHVTSYLEAFVGSLPPEVDVMWTGPSIVSPQVSGADAAALADALGRKLLFAENFPVNDGPMSAVLHLGPYPDRSPDLVEATAGVFCNFMSRPRASRLGLAAAARFWRDPHGDREAAWRECMADIPGIEPIARACRSWVGDDGPDPELLAWLDAAAEGDGRFLGYLQGGCRKDLDPALAAEIEPWLDQWDKESHAMQLAMAALAARPARPLELTFAMVSLWERARAGREQLFGIRWAGYPVTTRDGDDAVLLPEAVVRGENLTDQLCARAIAADS